MIIVAVAIALGTPRFAGDEFALTVRWEHAYGDESDPAGLYRYPEASGVLARGQTVVGVFHRETGELLFAQRRQPVFTSSDTFYLNQVPLEDTRWAVIDRRSGVPSFLDRGGVPRLYGPVLVQAERTALNLQHVDHPRPVRLPNQGSLTTVAVASVSRSDHELPGGDTTAGIRPAGAEAGADTGSGSIHVATGDLFGVVELLRVDFLSGRYERLFSVDTASDDDRDSSVVYGVHLETGDSARLIVLHGKAPQILEILEIPTGRTLLRRPVPDSFRVVSPPVVQRLADSVVVFGLRDALLFVDLREDAAVWTIPVDGLGAFAGFISVAAPILAVIYGEQNSLVLSLRETWRSGKDTAAWRFPDAYPAAVESDLLVVDTGKSFVALEIAR